MFVLSWFQVPIDSVSKTDKSDPVCPPLPVYTFCHQISGAEFEQQKLESSQKAMEELLEILVTDQNISEKDRRKKLKQVTVYWKSRRCLKSGSVCTQMQSE